MKSKKTQQEIIVTVLLVLIAIAAVVLISNFVINMVRERAAAGQSQVQCLALSFTINKAVNTATGVVVTRGVGGDDINISKTILLVQGISVNNTAGANWPVFSSQTINFTTPLATGQKVEIAPVLAGGVTCDPKDSYIVTAA